MSDIDFGAGADTATGDTVSAALTKLQNRAAALEAAGPTPGGSLPSLAFAAPLAQPEGNSGVTNFNFTLNLTRNGTATAIPVIWSVAGSGANPANAADFAGGALPSGKVTFAAGETSKTITVPVQGDPILEPDETFAISAQMLLGLTTTTGTIQNDDVSGVALPRQGAIVLTYDAATITGVADGGAVTSWTDSQSNIVATGGSAPPTFVANAVNNKPGVKGNGGQFLPIPSPGVYKTAIDSKNYTVIDVVIGTGSSTYGCPGGAAAGDGGFFPYLDGQLVGFFSSNTGLCWPTTSSGFMVTGFTSSTPNHGGVANAGLTRNYLNGSCYSSFAISAPSSPRTASTSGFAMLAVNDQGQLAANTTILMRYVWNVELTPPEVFQATQALYAAFGQTHPLTSADHFYIDDGDSLRIGVGADIPHSPSYLQAKALGLVPGQFTNVAIGGSTTTDRLQRASTEVDPFAPLLGSKTAIIVFEEVANDVPGLSPAQNGANQSQYVAARKSAFPGAKLVAVTPSDWNSGYKTTSPDGYNTYLVNNYLSMGYSAIARIDLNPTVGSDGGKWDTYPESGPYNSPFSDGVHFSDYTIKANLVAQAIQTQR